MEKKDEPNSTRGGSRAGSGRKNKKTVRFTFFVPGETTKLLGGEKALKKKIYLFIEQEALQKKMAAEAKRLEKANKS